MDTSTVSKTMGRSPQGEVGDTNSEPMAKKRKLSDSTAVLSSTSISNSSSENSGGPSSADENVTVNTPAADTSTVRIKIETSTSSSQSNDTTRATPPLSSASASDGSTKTCDSGSTTASSSTSPSKTPLQSTTTSGTTATNDSHEKKCNSTTSTSKADSDEIKPCTLEKKPTPPPPLKSTTMLHLRKKYMPQLEYMEREFKRLERQLLGARTRNGQEAAGSRERREKLHSFILHLEDTMKQIELGCKLENEGKSTLGVAFSSMGGGGAATGGSSLGSDDHQANGNQYNQIKGVGTNDTEQSQISQRVRTELNAEDEEAKEEFARSSALTKLTKEKEEEENVQRLEEHILANLLPVKDRLTRQLAAQEGAARNPAGMPASRGGLKPTSGERGQGTFAAAAEQRRLQRIQQQQRVLEKNDRDSIRNSALTHSQFGKPLGGGSSLTQKLHGATLGSHDRSEGHGVGSQGLTSKTVTSCADRKVIYAGMTPGSRQVKSGVSAASGVHDMQITSPRLKDYTLSTASNKSSNEPSTAAPPPLPTPLTTPNDTTIPIQKTSINNQTIKSNDRKNQSIQKHSQVVSKHDDKKNDASNNSSTTYPLSSISKVSKATVPPPPPGLEMTVMPEAKKKSLNDPTLTEEERQQLKNRRRIRKLERRKVEIKQRQLIMQQQVQQRQQEQQQIQQEQQAAVRRASSVRPITHKKGPRNVEYICALCNETYKSTCDYNPWWALTSHECMKCGKVQIPRLDIASPENAIEYHPALLAHANDDSTKSPKNTAAASLAINMKGFIANHNVIKDFQMDSTSFESDDLYSSDSDTSTIGDDMSPSRQAENEDFGLDYSGPKFSDYDASRLLIMFEHASTCPGRHNTKEARDICTGIKFMMLHVRDCPGTTSSDDICPFPWCRKTKHLLYHLVSCSEPEKCSICTGEHLTIQLRQLRGLNTFRRKKKKEKEFIVARPSNHKTPATVNASSTQTNTILRKKTALNNSTAGQKSGKVGPGQSQNLSLSKEMHSSKKISLSVPSPIPPLDNRMKVGKSTISKHPGAPLNQLSSRVNSATTNLSVRSHLTLSAPANPLLTIPKKEDVTPRTQNPIKSSLNSLPRPPQPLANPLKKQNTQPTRNVNEVKSVDTTIESSTSVILQNKNSKTQITKSATDIKVASTSNLVQNKDKPLQIKSPVGTMEQSLNLKSNDPSITKPIHKPRIKSEDASNNHNSIITSTDTNTISSEKTIERTQSETVLEVGC